MPTGNTFIDRWVDETRALTAPDRVVVCDGSEAEREALTAEGLEIGELIALNQDRLPGCVLHRSATDDEARAKLTPLFTGAMAGRTMYVVPFLMGPPGSRFSKVGVEITDSRYVVLNMRTMTRVGAVALEALAGSDDFTRCLHSLGDLSPERRFIVHFPEENTVWSIGSGWRGRKDGWPSTC
jgi:phosphoenolpyruvate carboxykinase (GTP)